ncbi:MAG TPA: response regulator, partial [Thermodesulfobacteriota bacterium]|nr:response regulator [Thermodesulfobacteriota bacterium]
HYAGIILANHVSAMKSNAGKPASGPEDEPAGRTKVLVVEDSEEFSTSVRELLASSGYTVLPTVSSGEEALRVAGKSKPDIVLVDVGLGGILDGIESGGRIAEEFGIPVIFLSGFTDEKALERAKTKRPSGYLVKPFNKAELKASIEIALYKHRPDEAGNGESRLMAPDLYGDASIALSGIEIKEMRDQITRLKLEICEYREIIDSLNKSLYELRGSEEPGYIGDERPAPAETKPRIELEFDSE